MNIGIHTTLLMHSFYLNLVWTVFSHMPVIDYVVLEEVLNKFIAERGETFLAAAKLKSKLKSADQFKGAEEVLKRLNHFCVVLGLDSNTQKSFKRKRSIFKNYPLV